MPPALHDAARQGDVKAIKKLLGGGFLRKKADANERDAHGMTALHWAALKGQLEAVQALLALGADPDAVDNSGMTPLHKAAMADSVEAAVALHAAGAMFTLDGAGRTPCTVAESAGHRRVLDELRRLFGEQLLQIERGRAFRAAVDAIRSRHAIRASTSGGPSSGQWQYVLTPADLEEAERVAAAATPPPSTAPPPAASALPAPAAEMPDAYDFAPPAPAAPMPDADYCASPSYEIDDRDAAAPDEFHFSLEPSDPLELRSPLVLPVQRDTLDVAAAEGRDRVNCTVFAPPEVRSPDYLLVQVFAHLPSEAEAAKAAAQEFDQDAQRRGVTALGTHIARSSVLRFDLSMRGLHVLHQSQELVWLGDTDSVQFEVEVPDGASGTIIGQVIVSQDGIPIGSVKFKTAVVADAWVSRQPEPVGQARRFERAFISYASADTEEVKRRVQMLEILGIKYFQDVLDLKAGDRWEPALLKFINDSDVMLLFWSQAAQQSQAVANEWQYALATKGDDFIVPVVIQGPPVAPPPPELQHLHFSDRIVYFTRPGAGLS